MGQKMRQWTRDHVRWLELSHTDGKVERLGYKIDPAGRQIEIEADRRLALRECGDQRRQIGG
jgi:hypothetical protein